MYQYIIHVVIRLHVQTDKQTGATANDSFFFEKIYFWEHSSRTLYTRDFPLKRHSSPDEHALLFDEFHLKNVPVASSISELAPPSHRVYKL